MEINIIFEKLNIIFRDIFKDNNIVLTDTLKASDIRNWDSLNNIRLIVKIENEFNILFSPTEVTKSKNVGEFVETISKKLL
jgi:acyl carrier protein